MCLFNISHFSSINKCKVMSQRTQEDAGEKRVTAKSKPMMNLVSRCRVRGPTVLASTAPESSGEIRSESRTLLSSWNEAVAHQTTHNGTLKTSGLLKCGNLVKCREQVRGDPYLTSWSSILVWTLTPPQNRTPLPKPGPHPKGVNDRLRKMLDHSPEYSMQDTDKRPMIWHVRHI